MKSVLPFLVLLASTLIAAVVASCADLKPVARTTHDVAKQLCEVFFSEKNAISIEEAGRAFCATERDLRPWIDEVLQAKHRASLALENGGDP